MRRTKIVATLGPACNSPEKIEQLILAGVDTVRLNFSHGSNDEHIQRAAYVREAAAKHSRHVAILGDLQGPKIRISRFKEGQIILKEGQGFILDTNLDKESGTLERVGVDYPELANDCSSGDTLLLDDGRIILEIESIKNNEIHCKVSVGGKLSNNKGINRKGGGLSADALTEKDKKDISLANIIGVDYLAVSFPRYASDIEHARKLLAQTGSIAGIIAKIERAEAVSSLETLHEIIDAADGVMVARGDLGVEIGDAELISVQKQIIENARKRNKVVITATQMMESMINSPMPTRAEVSDIANAVLDGTDAVMLSAETAAGQYPIEAVETMVRIIMGTEKHPLVRNSSYRLNQTFSKIDETIGLAAMYAANHLSGVKALVCLTETGATPLLMSRLSSGLPIFALSPNEETLRRVALYRGVKPLEFDTSRIYKSEINQRAVNSLVSFNEAKDGDLVVMTKGDYLNVHGGTNTMKIVRVGDNIL
ncbi:pyruvate kinase [Nitrincola sp.]|uniref:pyruvate kinase n=1 Tax=Nitrincola sp. TaxID=1926584 RepID=UPI003A93AF23